MYLIIDKSNNLITNISTTIDYEINGNYILDSGLRVCKFCGSKQITDCVQVENIPEYIEEHKYYYKDNKYISID